MSNKNPLLRCYDLPPFAEIKPEHVVPAIETVLANNRQCLEKMMTTITTPTWENIIAPLERMENTLHKVWSPVCHLHAVTDSKAWRNAYHAALPKVNDYYNEISQDSRLYQAYVVIVSSDDFATFNSAQQTVITHAIRDFKLSGVNLPPEQQQQYRKLSTQLAKLTSQYSENVLDATQAWTKHITDDSQLSGLPEHTKIAARNKAKDRELDGWVLGLDFPCYISVIMYADDRALREEIYKAYCTRASDQGCSDYDNSQLMTDILQHRQQLAHLLGFEHYAAYSLATKMADSVKDVTEFLHNIIDKTRPIAQKELDQLRQFAKQHDNTQTLYSWDISYYSEKQRQQQYQISQEALRVYFPLDQVLQGLFAILHKLYGLHITEEPVTAWDPTVRLLKICDRQQQLRGKIYFDLFARSNKRSGAWMDECQLRCKVDGTIQHPIAYLICNFAPPQQDKPALLTHEDVETLFHEFGHCLHHVLTQIDYLDVAGINGVPWDAVELPSQFMENWAWQASSLALFAKHYQTQAPLPDTLFQNVLAAKNFQSAIQLLRQMEFALFDLQLHTQPVTADLVQHTLSQVREKVVIMPVPDYNRFAHTFSHIFSGGYAAGYYSYAWADVLAADAFAEFLKNGIFDQATGEKFLHCILEKGGSQPPLDLFIDFCGRKPSVDALLHARGIL